MDLKPGIRLVFRFYQNNVNMSLTVILQCQTLISLTSGQLLAMSILFIC